MGHYAPQVRSICEYYAGLTEPADGASVDQIIDLAIPFIFTSNFPIYEEGHRQELCHKILRHYYMYEIGYEVSGEWKLELNTRMLEIMPKYNLLYAEQIKCALANYTRNSTRTNSGNNNANSTNTGQTTDTTTTNGNQESIARHSDTPQGSIQDLLSDNYLTSGDVENGTTNNTTTGEGHSTSTLTSHEDTAFNETLTESGINGASLAQIQAEFSAIYNDVDVLIIKDLSNLFCLLWG